MSYVYLLLAIVCETVATSTLKLSEQFTRPLPSLITMVGYAAAFYLLSLTLREVPVGIAYALWSAIGIVLVTIVGAVAFRQLPDWPALLGLVLIVAGVVVINVWSRMNVH